MCILHMGRQGQSEDETRVSNLFCFASVLAALLLRSFVERRSTVVIIIFTSLSVNLIIIFLFFFVFLSFVFFCFLSSLFFFLLLLSYFSSSYYYYRLLLLLPLLLLLILICFFFFFFFLLFCVFPRPGVLVLSLHVLGIFVFFVFSSYRVLMFQTLDNISIADTVGACLPLCTASAHATFAPSTKSKATSLTAALRTLLTIGGWNRLSPYVLLELGKT